MTAHNVIPNRQLQISKAHYIWVSGTSLFASFGLYQCVYP